jgi:hypothetical protein
MSQSIDFEYIYGLSKYHIGEQIERTRNWIPSEETDLKHCFRMGKV